jgi:hypothetical protein
MALMTRLRSPGGGWIFSPPRQIPIDCDNISS